MTAKEERFCEEYIIDNCAKDAAIRAGYKPNSAKVTGCRLLTKANCAKKIEELKKGISDRIEITADEITQGFKDIATNKESKDSDKIKAFENLGKRIGYYEEDNKQKTTLEITGMTIK